MKKILSLCIILLLILSGCTDLSEVLGNSSISYSQNVTASIEETEDISSIESVLPQSSETLISSEEKEGFKIAVICYGLWRPNGVPTIKNLIKKAEKQSDYQIIYFHGGKERIYEPEDWKIEACHNLVDAGADLIIGNHPHVLQPREIYKNTEIVYSLGNFCFGGNKKPGKNTVIYQMTLTIEKETLKLQQENSEFIPCYVYDGKLNNYQPCLVKDEKEKARVIDFMNGKVKTPYLD